MQIKGVVMKSIQSLQRVAALLTVLVFLPVSSYADMNGQEDQQDEEDRQEQLSANNTAFRGAQMLRRGNQAYAEGVEPNEDHTEASMFWSGDTLNFEVRSKETGNRMAVKIEFFWFEADKDRNSDFYVAIVRGNSSPQIGGNCLTLGDSQWQLGVDEIAQFVDVKAAPSGQGGAIRWDWSIPFQTYRYEPKQEKQIEQSYSLGAEANVSGELDGAAGNTSGGSGGRATGARSSLNAVNGKQIQAKGSAEGGADATWSHSVSTSYTLTLYRWQVQVSAGASGIKWAMVPMDPKKATDNAYHEYYLVAQSETAGQPFAIPEIEFGGTFECPRWSYLPDKTEKISATANNIRMSPPPVPDCPDDEVYRNGECVAGCSDGEVYSNGECEEETEEEEEEESCSSDDECSGDKVCESGVCTSSSEAECSISEDCGSDEVCDQGTCRTVECTSDADCGSDQKCSPDGRCIRSGPPPTGRSDAGDGRFDSPGYQDAGYNDAGSSRGQKESTVACSLSATGNGTGAPAGGFALFVLFGFAAWVRRRRKANRGGSAVAASAGLAVLAFTFAGCAGSSSPPEIASIGDQKVAEGETLTFDVVANGAESLKAKNLPEGAEFNVQSKGEGRFSWAPLISQTGEHKVDFIASNSQGERSTRVTIEVTGGCEAPEIIGSTNWVIQDETQALQRNIQVKENHCAKDIEWETGDLPEGMTFTPLVNRATVHWKPTEKQWHAQDEYSFQVTVTNDEGASTTKDIVVSLGAECPGTPAPEVESTTPSAQQGSNEFPVTAQIATEDNTTLKNTVLYYALEEDADPSEMVDTEMEQRSDTSDVWETAIELEEDLEQGESVHVTYRVCAVNSGGSGEDTCSVQGCTETLEFTGQLGTAGGLCTSCERDGECGGATDRCVTYSPGNAHCGLDCSSTGACPRGYECRELVGGYEQCVRNVDCGGSGEHRVATEDDLVLNEVLVHPVEDVNWDGTTSGTADQFVEIVSTASEIVDVGKFELKKDHDTRFSIPAGTTLAPGQALVIFGGGDPADFKDMGTEMVFSARPDRDDVGNLEFRRAGDTIRLMDRNGDPVIEFSYGDQSEELDDEIANDAQSITRAPQVEGTNWVKHSNAPGAGNAKYSPGRSSCGKRFPIAAHGGCGGEHCLGRATDKDDESNDSIQDAVCVSGTPKEIEGTLHYVWHEPEAPGPDPVDTYELELSAGETIDVGTYAGPDPDVSNTKLQILSEDERVLAENLHRHEVRDWYSQIDEFTAPESGYYYVRVTVPRSQTKLKGSYLLRIEPSTQRD